MRVRLTVISVLLLSLTLAAVFSSPGNMASARLQDATPEADVTPPASAPDVVTLVAWYKPDPSGEFLALGPLKTNDSLVASPAEATGRMITGKVDFDDAGNDDLPRIELGETAFNAYPLYPGDAESTFRWIYLDDDPGLRPATLVLQIEGVKGPYKGFTGTATFISRAFEAGGVLVIVLNPPG